MKTCNKCQLKLDLSFFHRGGRSPDGHQYDCKDCRRKRVWKDDPSVKKNRQLKSQYGIDLIEYNRMHTKQDGLCAICCNPEKMEIKGKLKKLSVDHCHETGGIRGLLCSRCNSAIGLFDEKPARMQRALTYVFAGGFDGLA